LVYVRQLTVQWRDKAPPKWTFRDRDLWGKKFFERNGAAGNPDTCRQQGKTVTLGGTVPPREERRPSLSFPAKRKRGHAGRLSKKDPPAGVTLTGRPWKLGTSCCFL
jgi:hypothetical protein